MHVDAHISIVRTPFDSPFFDPSGGHYIGFMWRSWYLFGVWRFDWYHPIFCVKRDILMNDSIAFVLDVSSITHAPEFFDIIKIIHGHRYRDHLPYKQWQPKQISNVFLYRAEKGTKQQWKKSREEILHHRYIYSLRFDFRVIGLFHSSFLMARAGLQ